MVTVINSPDKLTITSSWLKVSLCLSLFLLSFLPLAAQENSGGDGILRNDISVGCGYGVLMMLPSWSDDDDDWTTPSIHLQYLRRVNHYVGIGLSIDYTHSSWSKTTWVLREKYNKDNRFIGQDKVTITGKEGTEWFTFSPTVRMYWFNGRLFAMYSRMGLGILTATGHDSGVYIMPTFSPISLEAGGRHLRFFSEPLSVGTLGIINAGLKYSF